MPVINSPLGTQKIGSSNPYRELDVPDGNNNPFDVDDAIKNGKLKPINMNELQEFSSRLNASINEDPAQVEQDFKEARQARKRGSERLSEGARKRLEILIGMTRSTRAVEIEGTQFVLQTLKSKEMRQAILDASAFDRTVQSPFEIRRQLLAYSLVQIGGVDFDQFVGSSDLSAKLDFVEEMDHALLERLYAEYIDLSTEAKKKYAIKTEEDAKGVAEDLKKAP